jgi:hypothetical protein
MSVPDPTATAGDLGKPGLPTPFGRINDSIEFEHDLDDAVYFLQHGCVPCAERYFDRARRHGAGETDIDAARLRAGVT